LILHLGQLAEVVLSLPALTALRQRFPNSHITLAATVAGCQVVAMTGAVNDFLFVDSTQLSDVAKPWVLYRWIRFLQGLRQRGYDFAIELPSYRRTNMLTWLARLPVRAAMRRPSHSLDFLFNLWSSPKEDPRRHLVDRYFDMLRPLGIQPQVRRPQLRPLPEASARVEKRLGNKRPPQGRLLIGIYPSSGDLLRRWPIERFIDLGTRLIHNLGVDLLLLGGARESKLVQQINRQLPGHAVLLDNLTIPELVSALAACTVLISDDAGAINLAAATNTPVLGLGILFPATPVGHEHVILQRMEMMSITVDEAFTAVSRIITRDRTSTLFQ
jgi:ADP-heptose:LPS heptosyltransferase